MGILSIGDVNMLAIHDFSLFLPWFGFALVGYVGILAFFLQFTFCLAPCNGYAPAYRGGPEGIIDNNGWKIPACQFVVYPYDIGESSGDALVPGF